MNKAIFITLLLVFDTAHPESVPLIHERGTYLVPVLINGKISLNFTIDSGASDVSIPADVFSTLVRTGTVSPSDFVDTQQYLLADGTKKTTDRFRIRSLRVGDFEMRNVVAFIAPSEGSLLLGQSFLSRMKTWSIDNEGGLLMFDELPAQRVVHNPLRPSSPAAQPTASAKAKLSDYQLRQWGVNGDPAGKGTLRIRANILNVTNDSRPYPLLRVTLSDQTGRRIAAREFDPLEYLGAPPKTLLAAKAQANADFGYRDPGNDATNFEIDICVRGDNARLFCAGDSKLRLDAPR